VDKSNETTVTCEKLMQNWNWTSRGRIKRWTIIITQVRTRYHKYNANLGGLKPSSHQGRKQKNHVCMFQCSLILWDGIYILISLRSEWTIYLLKNGGKWPQKRRNTIRFILIMHVLLWVQAFVP